ncbi:MAG: septum formation initiator family protein [Parcubacteria group bacterium]|jgi:cell division protein FtsB
MSRFITITSASSVDFGKRKGAIKSNSFQFGRITLSFLLVAMICAAAVFYIFEVNNQATKGYEIKNLEDNLEALKANNEKLKIQAAELKSMYNIEEKTKELNMTAPKDISYINVPGEMAMK